MFVPNKKQPVSIPYKFILTSSFLLLILLSGCGKKADFIVSEFDPLANWQDTSKNKYISLDYTGAITEGFVIPSARQTSDGKFTFEFSIKNTSSKPQRYYYKIYYQNESYKFPEKDANAGENFYGSWEEVERTFEPTNTIIADGGFHKITSSFRIVGNPRDEKDFYGGTKDDSRITEEKVAAKIEDIKGNAEWFKYIKEKAFKSLVPVDDQLRRDAIYSLKEYGQQKIVNNRWKRNPRVGNYSFLLVVTSEKNILEKKIPEHIQNISLRRGEAWVNPYYYFLHGDGKNLQNTLAVTAEATLKVTARPDLSRGIFINPYDFSDIGLDTSQYRSDCNDSELMYHKAHIQQFVHHQDQKNRFDNIRQVSDVTGGEYTMADYRKGAADPSPGISVPIEIPRCPCKTVRFDSAGKKITITNPGVKPGEWRKENVGLISRHGFTYGKYRVKVKLTELLNKHNVWNGITNAVWLIYQQGEWNKRRVCKKEGYLDKAVEGKASPRQWTSVYSEIDIEVVKATRYWPKYSYQKRGSVPKELPTDTDKVMVTLTNWDLACREPQKFNIGAFELSHGGNTYDLHRWDDWYKAVTIKHAEKDNVMFRGEYFYFEIEWRPTEIIWRMGPQKDQMREIGYMNETVTSVPNNQMLMVITQEFHLAKWWPDAPFNQDKIPFPAKDITGEVHEIEIE